MIVRITEDTDGNRPTYCEYTEYMILFKMKNVNYRKVLPKQSVGGA